MPFPGFRGQVLTNLIPSSHPPQEPGLEHSLFLRVPMTLPMGLFSGEYGHVLSKVVLRDLRVRETRASSQSLGGNLSRRNFSHVVVSVDSFVDPQIQAVRADVSEKGLWQVKSVDCVSSPLQATLRPILPCKPGSVRTERESHALAALAR